MIQKLYEKEKFSAIGSTFVFFEVNGEYKQAFENINKSNNEINYTYLTINDKVKNEEKFNLQHYLLNVGKWGLLLGASKKVQLPILRNALGFVKLFQII